MQLPSHTKSVTVSSRPPQFGQRFSIAAAHVAQNVQPCEHARAPGFSANAAPHR
jgi:hypothetical protein